MHVYNLDKKRAESNLEGYQKENHYFIVAEFDDVEAIKDSLGIASFPKSVYENVDESIRFESSDDYNFISFVFFDLNDSDFVFEKINLYHSSNFLTLIVSAQNDLHNRIIDELRVDRLKGETKQSKLALICYHFLSNALSQMFDSLSRYEEILTKVEREILDNAGNYNFEKIVDMKGMSFKIKKYLRFLLHVGDQITENNNELLPKSMIKIFDNLDIRINRLYEFSEQIHEMAGHLLDLYDSTVTSKTNNLINKLTIFTVFATPLTVISGIYGMNFANMPELRYDYGYFIVLGLMFASTATTYFILKKIKLI